MGPTPGLGGKTWGWHWDQKNGTFPVLSPGHLANATTDLMKLDHEEEPQLSEPYLSKQKKLMVSATGPPLPLARHLFHGQEQLGEEGSR